MSITTPKFDKKLEDLLQRFQTTSNRVVTHDLRNDESEFNEKKKERDRAEYDLRMYLSKYVPVNKVPQIETTWNQLEFCMTGDFEIWYAKASHLIFSHDVKADNKYFPKSRALLQENYVKLGSIKATGAAWDTIHDITTNIPRIYSIFSTWHNNPICSKAVVELCEALGLNRGNMQVGDIIVNGDDWYGITNYGIEKLTHE